MSARLRSVPTGGEPTDRDLEDYEVFLLGAGVSDKRRREALIALTAFERFLGLAAYLARPVDVSRFLGRPHLSPGSRHTYFGVLRSYFRWHISVHPDHADPTAALPRPRQPSGIPKPLTQAQFETLLRTPMHRKTHAMILLAALAGLRVHEIAKVRGEDVDLDERTMFVYGKGQKEALIPLHPQLVVLAETMPRQGYWFPANSRGSGPVRPGSVGRTIGNAMDRAQIPGSAHSLRHWFATTLVRSGSDLRTVQTLMRHGSLQTTQRYVEVDADAQVRALDRLVLPTCDRSASGARSQEQLATRAPGRPGGWSAGRGSAT
ncbi:tyrosine-type recombinase/integrase [Rhodococcoides corynebacterioides]|uniref:tyrosine-type recombinase/integrase n=1 Tax=Rhodococcoides corynebacterioides TaxID=53972 RepID=UPI00082A091F|nr:tyrosine-type recombinase/integrase [Rhodococcus corynebacterioides]